jgi:hypothetical protein
MAGNASPSGKSLRSAKRVTHSSRGCACRMSRFRWKMVRGGRRSSECVTPTNRRSRDSVRSIKGTRCVGVRHSGDGPMGQGIRPSAGGRAMRSNGRECLTLREKPAFRKEADAFLARLRVQDVLLLVEDGPYSTRALGMRQPYEQAVSGQRAFCVWRPLGILCSEGCTPGSKCAPLGVDNRPHSWYTQGWGGMLGRRGACPG